MDKELWRLGPTAAGVFGVGQVCPDVGRTMAPWARRLGVCLACYAPIGRGGGDRRRPRGERSKKKGQSPGGEPDGRRRRWKKRERTEGRTEKRVGGERVKPALNGERGRISSGVKRTMTPVALRMGI
ncbi:hypothetical protein TNCV_3015341 [Trichonephila clavipes]|nr:hypothetical protein TNCV_3015341 [Trichonephila clavipes]